MDKYAGDRLHLYLLHDSMSNAPAASWEDHRVIRNNKQSAMSQILSLERSTSLLVSLFSFFLPNFLLWYTHMQRNHIQSPAGKHAFRLLFFCLSTYIRKHACAYITSSRWLDNLHQFKLATKKLSSPQSHYWLCEQESSGCFHCVWESHGFCWRMEIRERPSSPLLAHTVWVPSPFKSPHICGWLLPEISYLRAVGNGVRKYSGRWRW